ncbi:DUF4147 domain-containing protein [Candidatus Parcubacteria bacterium]|nr:DUF4147 domain-containing protein [Candidatus Parcubacteria bacterium]
MSIIKNKSEIGGGELRDQAIDIIEFGIKSVLPEVLMDEVVRYDKNFNSLNVRTSSFNMLRGRIFVVGGGKAAGAMAKKLEEIIGAKHITFGLVNSVSKVKTKVIKVNKAGFPIPDKKGLKGVEEMLKIKDKYKIAENDLVICLLSGGGSALMPAPVSGVSLNDEQIATKALITSGAEITEINTVRKHLSLVKGGRLGEYFKPATVVSIIISDVVGDKLSVIASGPTVPDPSTFSDAVLVIEKYQLINKISASVQNYLREGLNGNRAETPKHLDNTYNYVIGNNSMALENMALRAKQLGLRPIIASVNMAGDPVLVAEKNAKAIVAGEFMDYDCILFGGETTPILPERHGQGGRNMHYAAASLKPLEFLGGEWVMASICSDGADYLNLAAGAIIDQNTLTSIESAKLNIGKYLADYDSYNLFNKLNSALIKTGNTGTNVCDAVVYLRNSAVSRILPS